MKTKRKKDMPYMRSMVFCLGKVMDDGYTEHFYATNKGLQAAQTNKLYTPGQVKLVNFFRFEGFIQPQENAILYVIETTDGMKGTLIDDYSSYPDSLINRFMTDVKNFSGKTSGN